MQRVDSQAKRDIFYDFLCDNILRLRAFDVPPLLLRSYGVTSEFLMVDVEFLLTTRRDCV